MKENDTTCFDDLKIILKNMRSPERLNDHPWTQSLIVQAALTSAPQLKETLAGQQLVGAIASLFQQMQPPAPPRRGKRLDPRWGEFGLLAALYFVPFNHGTAFPGTLLEAWARIDPAILYFVYGKPAEALQEHEVQRYQLVGEDLEYGSASTLSDWHKKGLQRFTEIILNQERLLSRTSQTPSVILGSNGHTSTIPHSSTSTEGNERKPLPVSRRKIWLSLVLLLIVLLGLAGFQGWKIYGSGRLLYQDATQLRELVDGPVELETVSRALPLLKTVRSDLYTFKKDARVLLWLSPRFSWIPIYGNEIASAPALLDLAEHLLEASILSAETAQPVLKEFNSTSSSLAPADLSALLVQAQPALQEARQELDQALAARGTIEAEHLSPRLQRVLLEELDPLLTLADEGLSLSLALPGLAGAGSEGPKTYLLLVQNEDELRPTGGFITAIGNLVLHNGQVISLDFEEAGELEDWSKPYPAAPWQLRQYMNSPVLVLRDSNWFPHFPTTALWAEYLYAYTHSHSVDGVIAFDQHLLVMLLSQLGPLEVEGVPYAITNQNVIEYMRQAKAPPSGPIPEGWYRKEFIAKLADAVLARLTGGDVQDWQGLAQVLSQALAERHLLLQFDDPTATRLIARLGWDNAIHPGRGDFLLVTDTNIGFNKTNAVVKTSLSYDIDLTDLSAPEGTLVVTHTNQARKDVPCIHWNNGEITGEEQYPINRCYWNYLRIYKQEGVELLDASPHDIPGERMILGEPIPAQVDDLDEELDGVRGFGTLLVVPGGETMSTSFTFALPPDMLSAQDVSAQAELTYRLTVHKQPGTLAIPILIRIHLPNRAAVKSISTEAVLQDNHLLIETNLQRDLELELVFSLSSN